MSKVSNEKMDKVVKEVAEISSKVLAKNVATGSLTMEQGSMLSSLIALVPFHTKSSEEELPSIYKTFMGWVSEQVTGDGDTFPKWVYKTLEEIGAEIDKKYGVKSE